MRLELLLRVAEVGALITCALIVHLQHMCGQAFGARGFIVAQQANKRFCMCVQMTLQAPLIRARPWTVAAGESFLTFRLKIASGRASVSNNATIVNVASADAADANADTTTSNNVILLLLLELW